MTAFTDPDPDGADADQRLAHLNSAVVAEFRANAGRVSTNGFGSDVVILHSVGARTGAIRLNPLRCIVVGDDRYVIGGGRVGRTVGTVPCSVGRF